MFTQCPECGTVFRVTATVLRAAQGQVRCGVCDASFDALRFLMDAVDAPPPKSAEPAASGKPSGPRIAASATRTTPSEDEGRALAELAANLARTRPATAPPAPAPPTGPTAVPGRPLTRASAPPTPPAAPAQAQAPPASPALPPPASRAGPSAPPPPAPTPPSEEINVLEPMDVEHIVLGDGPGADGDIPEAALEFNVPPGEWDRVFVAEDVPRQKTPLDINLSGLETTTDEEASATGSHDFVLLEDSGPERAADTSALRLVDDDALSRTDEYATLDVELEEPATVAGERGGGIEEAWFDPAPAAASPVVSADAAAAAANTAPPPPEAAPDTELPLGETPVPRHRAVRIAFDAGSVLLVVALLVQLVHHNRDALAASSLAGSFVTGLYARLGHPLEPRWDLTAYEVKQWGAATDAAPGALRLRASIANRASRAQPYPLLRVTLEDRFGAKIARGEFAPAEYLPGRAAPGGLLAAGARADADLLLDDPGSLAVGFELDVCLTRAGALVCGVDQKSAGG